MQDLQLVSLWEAPKEKDSYVYFHDHQCYELVYYTKGKGRTKIGDTDYYFTENSFTLIPPGVLHDEIHIESGHVICLEFRGQGIVLPACQQDSFGGVLKVLQELFYEIRHQRYGYKEMIGVKLNELILNIHRSSHAGSNEKNLEYAVNYLRENYRDKVVLSECAKQLHISYDYFQHKFKAYTGVSPRRFLIERRLEAAVKMLENTQLPCTEIAWRAGFSTSAQFSALFRREKGISPLQYQKKCRLSKH